MSKIQVCFDQAMGSIKPMHATNNGPVVRQRDMDGGTLHPFNSNLEEFRAAGIPYARTHDASFYHRYGLEHTVDVYNIFPNPDADPYDPASYDFVCTDEYIRGCYLADTEVFYRLGHRIEHEVKRYGTLPPKDFHTWAVVCEHIIRHYTEGWADGFRYKMTYWEIWNEPDLHWNDGKISPTWGGTPEQFFALYHVTATHLKTCFPHLKIGGPALAHDLVWAENFLAQLCAPLDFFSWHCYFYDVESMLSRAAKVRALLDKYGYGKAESILNEWNYVRGWTGDDIVYSHEHRGRIKGASLSVAAMCAAQYSSVDMLMYYDARPNEFWNGLFDVTVVGRVLKGYYPFPMFNTLYRLGTCVACDSADADVYACAAKSEDEAAVLLTYYRDEESESREVSISLTGFGGDAGTEAEFYLLDEAHDATLVGRATYFGDRFVPTLTMLPYSAYLIKLKKANR